MEKTKQISLVRTLIAAALLLIGSSGGVAWGQSYTSNNGGTPHTIASPSNHGNDSWYILIQGHREASWWDKGGFWSGSTAQNLPPITPNPRPETPTDGAGSYTCYSTPHSYGYRSVAHWSPIYSPTCQVGVDTHNEGTSSNTILNGHYPSGHGSYENGSCTFAGDAANLAQAAAQAWLNAVPDVYFTVPANNPAHSNYTDINYYNRFAYGLVEHRARWGWQSGWNHSSWNWGWISPGSRSAYGRGYGSGACSSYFAGYERDVYYGLGPTYSEAEQTRNNTDTKSIIIISLNASVRLRGNSGGKTIEKLSDNPGIQQQNQLIIPTGSYAVRFDYNYDGRNNVELSHSVIASGPGVSNNWPDVEASQVLGFWQGYTGSTDINFKDNSTLLLGNNTVGQDKFKMATTAANGLNVFNYWTNTDALGQNPANNFMNGAIPMIPTSHGIYYDIPHGNINHSGTGTYLIKNYNSGGNGCDNLGWIHVTQDLGDNYVRGDGGKFFIEANGYIQLDKGMSMNTVHGAHHERVNSSGSFIYSDKGITWKGNDGGLLDIYAQGPYTSPSRHCGYVGINGNVTTNTTGSGLATGIGVLKDQFNPDRTNLARQTDCNNGNLIKAHGSLETIVQTAIRSANDSIHIEGNLDHTAIDGALWIQGARQVHVTGTTKIDYTNGTGDAAIRSVGGAVIFGGAFTYKGNVTTDLFIDGKTGVTFNSASGPSTIDYTQGTDPTAHIGIQSNSGTIAFRNNPFTFKSKSTGETQLWAGDSIISTDQAPLIFKYAKADAGQDIDWYAGKGIRLNGELTFKHDDAINHTGFIKLRANTNDSVLWNELPFTTLVKRPGETRCPQKCTGSGNVGDIFLNADVKVNYQGKQDVWMSANNDIHVRRNYTHVAGGNGQVGQGYTRFVAGHDIVTGEAGVPAGTTGSTFSYLHKGDKGGNFDMKALNDIITHNKVDIKYDAVVKDALVTTLSACRNIDIRNSFWYSDNTGSPNTGKWARFYAGQSILSNSGCLNYGAPINFYTNDNTLTEWNAGQNIITKDSVNFRYGDTQHKVRDLSLVAQGGNIEMWRWTNVNYDSDSTILFSAERNKPYSQAVKAQLTTNGGAKPNNSTLADAPRFEWDGHIYFNDSANITRNNDHDGTTKIFADYHIRTAIMSIKNTQPANENKTTIESHKGDIWLGYSVEKPDGCAAPQSDISYDHNLFLYKDAANSKTQSLKIRAGYQDQGDSNRYNGGNIYIVQMKNELTTGGTTNTEITIPFSNEYKCGSTWSSGLLHNRQKDTMMMYEHAGIIFGLGHCGKDENINSYAPGIRKEVVTPQVTKLSLEHRGNKGNLLVDAGKRGNIIINKGANLNFQDTLNMTGDAIFRTRFGDIDMREKFDADTMRGSLLFLAQTENLSDLSKIGICGCEEERNNVYLQDFQYRSHMAGGSVFVGADNNIKLNYGGLQNIGTRHDPFLSKDYTVCPDGKLAKIGYGYDGASCNDDDLHCDAVEPVNKARKLILNFEKDDQNKAITKGGFAAVASDYIDVYKKMVYRGGRGSGMSSVPGTGTLHGETVNGYGLFMKTQANKNNWTINIFKEIPKCPTTCAGDNCDRDYLHMVSRMTFHDEADIQAHNQKVMLWSPVVETYGKMTLDTKTNSGNNTEITLKADSLIFHDDFVKIGNKTKLSTWSGLKNDKPIMKFGHMRKTPPFRELKKDNCQTEIECIPCHYYIRGSKDPVHMLDTITIKFGDDAYLERLNTVVFDHTVLTCLTDSFDHIKGAPVLNAQVRTDTLKIRNQVDLFADKNHERDAHLELISERQMGSKDYAGIYTKHLHMEPVGACGTPYSELWTSDDLALDVITTSIFGGFGFIHSDVHVENGAHLNAGFTSLRLRGLCYEQLCGTQRMKDLRLDVGAQLHFSVGTTKGLNGEYSDAIEVEKLTTYGSVDVNIEIRPCEKMEKRCYPIIYYKSLTPNSLNNLKVKPATVKIDGQDYPLHLNIGTDGIVYVCVGDAQPVDLTRTVTIPTVAGVKTDPAPGIWEVKSRGNFKFKATYTGKPLAVRTSRMVNGAPEMLTGKKNANGEYEYVIPHVQEDITLTIGPDFVANELLAGTAVWSHGEMIYIRVDRADIASIYSVAGQLVRKIDLPEGDTSIPMSRGAYVITLKDGSVHKVIVK